mmetsp:Transcript_87964/g.122042  ORF Transcript_87964/g.122042 Transcript_87964/m.122042 type:complete len:98 (+) Transcript_87964:169-462(+)
MFQTWGWWGFGGVMGMSVGSLWVGWKSFKFTAEMAYYRIIRGDVNQLQVEEKNSIGDYYFSDSYNSSAEEFPKAAGRELAESIRSWRPTKNDDLKYQ